MRGVVLARRRRKSKKRATPLTPPFREGGKLGVAGPPTDATMRVLEFLDAVKKSPEGVFTRSTKRDSLRVAE